MSTSCPGRAFLASILISILSPLPLFAQASSDLHLPISPKDLIGALPSPPQDWKLATSQAKHQARIRPLSLAYREYRYTPPPDATGATPPPVTVKFTALDAATNPEITANLLGQENLDGGKRLTINSMPARRMEVTGEAEHLEAVALQRFLITVVIVGETKEKAEDWLKRINVETLRQATAKTAPFDPKRETDIITELIDELNPSRSRKGKAIVGGEDAPTTDSQ